MSVVKSQPNSANAGAETRDVHWMSQVVRIGLKPASRADACQARSSRCWCSGRFTGVGVEDSSQKRGQVARAQATTHSREDIATTSEGGWACSEVVDRMEAC